MRKKGLKRRHLWLMACILMLVPGLAHAAGKMCSEAAIQRAAADVAQERRVMLTLPAAASDPAISGAAIQAITEIKNRLSQVVQAYMACAPVASIPDPERIKKDLSELAHAFSKGASYKGQPEDSGKFGFELRFSVRVSGDAGGLVSIAPSFSLPCGTDTLLLIFARERDSWRQVIRWQSPPYRELSGAAGDLLYGISAPDSSKAWYVLVTYIEPWCSSTWSVLHYEVLRPAADDSKQKVLLREFDEIWWGGDNLPTLAVKPAAFELRFEGSSIDQDVQGRVVVRRFEVVGNRLRRVQPVALFPRDFVDEWIVSPWALAAQWSAPSRTGTLRQMHERFLGDRKSRVSFSFESVQQCSGAADDFQVGACYGNWDCKKSYFRVRGESSFIMTGIRTAPDPQCAGKILWTRDNPAGR